MSDLTEEQQEELSMLKQDLEYRVDYPRKVEDLPVLIKACYLIAKDSGFHEGKTNFAEKLALVHSEVSEALEALRDPDQGAEEFAEEMADVVIRCLDLALLYGEGLRGEGELDRAAKSFEKTILNKCLKNIERPHKHGKEF